MNIILKNIIFYSFSITQSTMILYYILCLIAWRLLYNIIFFHFGVHNIRISLNIKKNILCLLKVCLYCIFGSYQHWIDRNSKILSATSSIGHQNFSLSTFAIKIWVFFQYSNISDILFFQITWTPESKYYIIFFETQQHWENIILYSFNFIYFE